MTQNFQHRKIVDRLTFWHFPSLTVENLDGSKKIYSNRLRCRRALRRRREQRADAEHHGEDNDEGAEPANLTSHCNLPCFPRANSRVEAISPLWHRVWLASTPPLEQGRASGHKDKSHAPLEGHQPASRSHPPPRRGGAGPPAEDGASPTRTITPAPPPPPAASPLSARPWSSPSCRPSRLH